MRPLPHLESVPPVNPALSRVDVIEPAAHLVTPPHLLAVRREQQDGAVVDDDLHGALVVLDA